MQKNLPPSAEGGSAKSFANYSCTSSFRVNRNEEKSHYKSVPIVFEKPLLGGEECSDINHSSKEKEII
jgi:hypothetical protein